VGETSTGVMEAVFFCVGGRRRRTKCSASSLPGTAAAARGFAGDFAAYVERVSLVGDVRPGRDGECES
jgi:hypothetical protein